MLRRLDMTTVTWIALLALTLVGAFAATHTAPGTRWLMGWLVAALCVLKARLLINHYLHVDEAGPVFSFLVRAFAALAPLGLALSAVREAWLG